MVRYGELVKNELTIFVYDAVSIIFGMLDPNTNCAADAGQKAALLILFFSEILTAHPMLW